MSVTAYQKAQHANESLRTTEYRLFAQVTGALMEVEKAGRHDAVRLIDVLDWNRRVWSALASDCASEGNSLPDSVRAGIISLAIWVSRYSSSVVQEGESLEPLIDVNKDIMAGLAARS